MDVNDGGPAFPMRPERREPVTEKIELVTPGEWPGMTLRDYFAAKALAGLSGSGKTDGSIASLAYSLADAMLAERAK